MAGSAGDVILSIKAPIRALGAGGMSFAKPLGDVLKIMQAGTRENFRGQHDPQGRPWAALQNPWRKRGKRRIRAKILQDTLALFRSTQSRGAAGAIAEITDKSLSYGSAVFYARFHQRGTRKMPRRQFIGVNEPILKRIERVFREWAVSGILRDMGGRFRAG